MQLNVYIISNLTKNKYLVIKYVVNKIIYDIRRYLVDQNLDNCQSLLIEQFAFF